MRVIVTILYWSLYNISVFCFSIQYFTQLAVVYALKYFPSCVDCSDKIFLQNVPPGI